MQLHVLVHMSKKNADYLQVVQRLKQAVAASQPFQAAQEFGTAAAQHFSGETPNQIMTWWN